MIKTVLGAAALSAALLAPVGSPEAKEFKVACSDFADCMKKGDKLTKKRKLSMAQEAYRSAIKFNPDDKKAWQKFEKIVVRISEEGGC